MPRLKREGSVRRAVPDEHFDLRNAAISCHLLLYIYLGFPAEENGSVFLHQYYYHGTRLATGPVEPPNLAQKSWRVRIRNQNEQQS
jgi:hypothetical protein